MENRPERQIIERYEFSQDFNEQLVFEIHCKGKINKKVVEEYQFAGS